MHFTHIQGLLLAASSAAAKTITINGGNLYFDPPNVNASVGDILEFHFLPNNHSVVMGDFENVCQPAVSGGFYSGFLPAESGENPTVFQVTINDTNPMVYYCSQNAPGHNHCAGGMFGFINQQNQSSIDRYNSSATNSQINITPDGGVFGGLLVSANATGNSTGSNTGGGSSSGTSTGTGSSSSSTGEPLDNSAGSLTGGGLVAVVMTVMTAMVMAEA